MLYKSDASFTVFVIVPGQSKLEAIGITPKREFLPYDGLKPTTLHILAGCLKLPPVSVPSDAGVKPAATAAAEPELEPPGILFFPHGLITGPVLEFSHVVPIANSSIFTFPREFIPDSLSLEITVASYGGTKSCNIVEEAVVGIPFSQKISFTPRATHAKAVSDEVSLKSSFMKLYAFIVSLYFLDLSKK